MARLNSEEHYWIESGMGKTNGPSYAVLMTWRYTTGEVGLMKAMGLVATVLVYLSRMVIN